jgi:hypothetical protein
MSEQQQEQQQPNACDDPQTYYDQLYLDDFASLREVLTEVQLMNEDKPDAPRSAYRIIERPIARAVIENARHYNARYVVWMRQHDTTQEWLEYFRANNSE